MAKIRNPTLTLTNTDTSKPSEPYALNKVLTAEELAPVLDAMRQQLISKNVASEIALNITETVKATLVGQKLASFTRVKTMVTQALKSAVMRVLTPKKSTDILHEIISNRRCVVCGVCCVVCGVCCVVCGV